MYLGIKPKTSGNNMHVHALILDTKMKGPISRMQNKLGSSVITSRTDDQFLDFFGEQETWMA